MAEGCGGEARRKAMVEECAGRKRRGVDMGRGGVRRVVGLAEGGGPDLHS